MLLEIPQDRHPWLGPSRPWKIVGRSRAWHERELPLSLHEFPFSPNDSYQLTALHVILPNTSYINQHYSPYFSLSKDQTQPLSIHLSTVYRLDLIQRSFLFSYSPYENLKSLQFAVVQAARAYDFYLSYSLYTFFSSLMQTSIH